jgi:membrane protein
MADFKPALRYLNELRREFTQDDVSGLAAELAFRFFMALFPFLLVLVTLGALISRIAGVDDPSGRVVDAVGTSLPADAASVLRRHVNEVVDGANVGVLSIGLVTALWAAAGGARALIKATNRVYDLPETRSTAKQIGIALGLTSFGGLGLLVAVAAMVLSQTFADSIASALGMGAEFAWAVQILRLPLIVVFVAAAVEMVYWLGPATNSRPQFVSRGAIVFALGWSGFTVAFAFYVSNFGSYGATYGALAGVVILLVWFYVSSLLMLLGAEINSLQRASKESPGPGPVVAAEVSGATHRSAPGMGWAVAAGVGLALLAWARRSGERHG